MCGSRIFIWKQRERQPVREQFPMSKLFLNLFPKFQDYCWFVGLLVGWLCSMAYQLLGVI